MAVLTLINNPLSIYWKSVLSLSSIENIYEDNGGEWNRTTDPGLMSPLLYQLSYAA